MFAKNIMLRRYLHSAVKVAAKYRNPTDKLPSGYKYLQRHPISYDATSKMQQVQFEVLPRDRNQQEINVSSVTSKRDSIEIEFSNGIVGSAPHLWLRENCQCSKCYDHIALGRKFLITDLTLDVLPTKFWQDGNYLRIRWSDNHEGYFSNEWLYYRAFTAPGKHDFDKLFKPKKVRWGTDLSLDFYDYNTLMKDERTLLQWLKTIESKGVALVRKSPGDPDAGASLIDHVAFVKPSHYGRHSPVINRPNSNNVAFTNLKLGMHTDLSQYDYQAGIILIHALVQHEGSGGESILADGLHCADLLKERHPEAFRKLTTTDVYFWDKGFANFGMEMDNFYKMNRGPILRLNNSGEIDKISVNNAVRDSFMDLPPWEVNDFYRSMMTYHDLLYDNAFKFKMQPGDIITMDNVRCLHGREGYASDSPRHIESSYLDWDEASCRRRRLQEAFPDA